MKPDVIMLNEVGEVHRLGQREPAGTLRSDVEQLTGRKWYGLFRRSSELVGESGKDT